MSAAKNLRPPWQPGQSGNPTGSRKKLLSRVDEVLHSKSLHPVEELLLLIPRLTPRDQAQVWMDLLAYVQAKPKQEMFGEEEDLSKLSTAELIELVKQKVPELGKAG